MRQVCGEFVQQVVGVDVAGIAPVETPSRMSEFLQQIELALAHGIPLAEVAPQRPEFQREEAGKDE
jgi:hypothetical protein